MSVEAPAAGVLAAIGGFHESDMVAEVEAMRPSSSCPEPEVGGARVDQSAGRVYSTVPMSVPLVGRCGTLVASGAAQVDAGGGPSSTGPDGGGPLRWWGAGA